MTNSAHRNQGGRVILLLFTLFAVAADTPDTAIQKVRQGLQHYRDNEFEEAETAFAEASEAAPKNPVITFDEACAARAAGDVEQARSLFRKAAAAKDPSLAVKSHYNLGCLEADQARKELGEDPLAAVGDTREEAINVMLAAVAHYRDALRLDADHKEARHNLELIRLYIKHIQSQWAERDKQKARDEKNLLQFLKMIEDRETEIRRTTRLLDAEADSVSKRKAVAELIDVQRTLQEELEPLKQKISQELRASQQQPASSATGQPDIRNEQNQQAEELLNALADEAGKQMIAVADSLQSKDFEAAERSETDSLNQLNQIYMVIAPYPILLQRAIQQQQSMVPNETDVSEETNGVNESDGDDNHVDVHRADTAEVNEAEAASQAEQQSRISDWAQVLALKAEQALPAMKQQLDAISQTSDSAGPEHAEGELGEGESTSDEDQVELTKEQKVEKQQQEQMQQQLKQIESLVKSMELAVALGPEAEAHSRTAHQDLLSKDVSAARPEQQETLRILKEIAEPLEQEPPSEQDQKNQDQQQNQNDKDNQEQQKPEQEPSNKEDESSEKQEQKQQERQSEQKKQQAETVLRQARDRERKHREMQKQIQAILGRAIKVDKDW